MGRARKPKALDTLLAPLAPRKSDYYALIADLKNYVRPRDAKVLAWYALAPRLVPEPVREPFVNSRKNLLPTFDTLRCLKCNSDLKLRTLDHRFNPKTLKFDREVFYVSQEPQSCSCGNLTTFIDRNRVPRVYTDDPESFKVLSGPIDITMISTTIYEDTEALLDSPRPEETNPFGLVARSTTLLNHVNLLRVSEHTLAAVMPYEDLRLYSRAFGIVIFAGLNIYIPTGHVLKLKHFPEFPFHEFDKPIVTKEVAERRNELVLWLVQDLVPNVLDELHHELAEHMAQRLKIKRSYAPTKPTGLFLARLLIKTTGKRLGPLNYYPELFIARLPTVCIPKGIWKNHQDFVYPLMDDWRHPVTSEHFLLRSTESKVRRYVKESQELIKYMLARRTQSPKVIYRYARQILRHNPAPQMAPFNPIAYPRSPLPLKEHLKNPYAHQEQEDS